MLGSTCVLLIIGFLVSYRWRLRKALATCSTDEDREEARVVEKFRFIAKCSRGLFVVFAFVYEVTCVEALNAVYCTYDQGQLLLAVDKQQVHFSCVVFTAKTQFLRAQSCFEGTHWYVFGVALAVLAGVTAFPLAVAILMAMHLLHKQTTFIGGQILMIAQEEYKHRDFFFGLLELLVVRWHHKNAFHLVSLSLGRLYSLTWRWLSSVCL